MNTVPSYLDLSFIFITLLATVALLWWVIRESARENKRIPVRIFRLGNAIWLGLQGILAYQGVYIDSLDALPSPCTFRVRPYFAAYRTYVYLPFRKTLYRLSTKVCLRHHLPQ